MDDSESPHFSNSGQSREALVGIWKIDAHSGPAHKAEDDSNDPCHMVCTCADERNRLTRDHRQDATDDQEQDADPLIKLEATQHRRLRLPAVCFFDKSSNAGQDIVNANDRGGGRTYNQHSKNDHTDKEVADN